MMQVQVEVQEKKQALRPQPMQELVPQQREEKNV